MTEVEKAYIAGIIDGEGSIILQKFHKNQFPSPCVSIASTSMELLTWIRNIVGKGKIISKKNYNPEKHKDCYSYILKYNNSISFIEEIYPYLIIKGKIKRANLILTRYKEVTPRNGRYSSEMLKSKEQLYLDFIAIK